MQSKYEKRWPNCFDKYLSLIEFDDFRCLLESPSAKRFKAEVFDLRCRVLGAPR